MTDKKRIEILEEAKMLINSGMFVYICPTLQFLANESPYISDNAPGLFPELLKHKPKNKKLNWHWWSRSNIAIRIRVLNSMITEIKANSND